MRVRVKADDGSSDGGDEEVATVSEDVDSVIPEVLLTNERRRKVEVELLGSVVRKSVVWVNVVVDKRGGLQDDDVFA